jgi:hypothetical protein
MGIPFRSEVDLILISAFFWDITLCNVVTSYQLFSTTNRSHFQRPESSSRVINFSTLEDGIYVFSRNVDKELPLYAA